MIRTGSLNPAVMPIVARVLPFAAYIGFLAFDRLMPDAVWGYAIRIGVVSVLLAIFARSYLELRNAGKASLNEWLLALGIGALVFVLWIHLDVPWLSFGQSQAFDPTLAAGGIDWRVAAMRVFGAAIVVPVMEELFWRSFILRSVDRGDFLHVPPSQASGKALVISAVLFGFEHELWFAGVLAGLAYGWLYTRSGNLWLPIVAHGVTNLMLAAWVLWTGNWQFW
jgi:uncharacterized protein